MPRELTFTSVDLTDSQGEMGWIRRIRDDWAQWTEAVDPASTSAEAQAAALMFFDEHLPELTPIRNRLAEQIGCEGAAALLTHSTLRSPFESACSQAAVGGSLFRNYDFSADLCDRIVLRTNFLRPVIGMGDVLWGMLDGMNDAGLAISLTYGGRPASGRGFTVLMLVRYLLETCDTVAEAWAKVKQFPVATVQNLTIVDAHEAMTVYIGPDRPPTRLDVACATNHQDYDVSPQQEQETSTLLRLKEISRVAETATAGEVMSALLKPPLYVTGDWGTLYTAAYVPAEGRVTYAWPDAQLEQSFETFTPGELTVVVP